jgi:hypothetical protein
VKSWAHPRNLIIADASSLVFPHTLDWTEHEGVLLGHDTVDNKLIYAITDFDGLGVWVLENQLDFLEAVKRTFP